MWFINCCPIGICACVASTGTLQHDQTNICWGSHRACGPTCPIKTLYEQLDCFHSRLSFQIQEHFVRLLCCGMKVLIDSLLVSPVSAELSACSLTAVYKPSLLVRLWVSIAPSCTHEGIVSLFSRAAYNDHSSSKSLTSKLHFIFVTLCDYVTANVDHSSSKSLTPKLHCIFVTLCDYVTANAWSIRAKERAIDWDIYSYFILNPCDVFMHSKCLR